MTRSRSQPPRSEVPAAGMLSDREQAQVGQAVQEKIRSQAPPSPEAQPQKEPQPAVLKGEIQARPAAQPPLVELPTVVVEPGYAAAIADRPERRASVLYGPQDSKDGALWFAESYSREVAALRARIEELNADLRPYLALSLKKRRKPEVYAQYEQIAGKLGAIDAQAALQLPDLSDSLRATLEALRSEGLDELTRARQNIEAAKKDAARLGAAEQEIAAAAPAAEAPSAAPPAPEARPALVEQPPAPQPGESQEEYLKKWALWGDALKSGGKGVFKIAWGVASTLLGVRLAQTGLQFGIERWKRRKEKKAFAEMAGGLEAALKSGARAPEAEYETAFGTLIKKMQTLETRLDALVSEGKLKPEDREGVLNKIREVVSRAQQQEGAAQATLNQEVERILHDYFQTKVSKIELGKQTLNTGLLLAGAQTARALGYGAFTALGRAVKARKEYEEKIKVEGRPADFWQRERAVLQNLVPQAAAEYARGISGMWADLFTGRRVSRSEWARKKMEFGKALSTTFIFAGMAKVAHAEVTETGYSVEAQIDRLFETIAKRGGLGGAIAHNWLHNIDQLSFGFTRFSQDGELQVANNPDQGVTKAPEAATAPAATEAPEITKTPEQIAYENALQRLENTSAGKVDFNPETGRLEITLGKGGYEHIQQALRDIAVLEKMVAGKEFTTVDAAQVENVVANLKYLLEGKDLRFMEAERLDGIAHVGAGKLIIDDVTKFHAVMQSELVAHAAGKITAATLDRYDEAVATVNNTSDANWQKDVNVGTGAEEPSAIGYVKTDIDHQVVHQAEIEVAQHTAQELGIAGARVDSTDVADEDTFYIKVGKDVISVQDGFAERVIVYRGEGVDAMSYKLSESISVDHPYAGEDLKHALDAAYTEAIRQGGGAAEAATPPPAAPELPHDFKGLVQTLDQAGLVRDGAIHFGEVRFEQKWLDDIDHKTVGEFTEHPTTWWMRMFDPERAHAQEALAKSMEGAQAGLKVREFIADKLDILKTLKAVPRVPGPGEGIGGV